MILVLILLFILFIIWTYLMLNDKFFHLDNTFYNKLVIKEPYTTFFKIFTNLANFKFFIIVIVFLFIFLDNKKFNILLTILMITSAILIFTVKKTFKRKRPEKKALVKEKGYSYPSGHMLSAICFYGSILFIIFLSNIIWPIKLILMLFIIVIIVFIGISRIYVILLELYY